MTPPVKTYSQTEIAAEFRKSTRTIRNWQKSGMPHRMISGEPRYVLADCMAWREDRVREEAKADESPDEAKERARGLRAQADLRELELAERRGQLVAADVHDTAVETLVAGLAATAAGQLARFERDIVQATTPAEARLITQRIHAALMRGAQDYADVMEAEAAALEQEDAA
jgi:transposase